MIKYILCFLPILAFGQAPSPISNSHIIVYPGYGKLAEIKPDVEYKVPFAKKEDYKDIVFHRSGYDTAAEYELFFTLKKKTTTTPVIVPEIVDDRNALIKYAPAWVPYTGSVYQDGTAQYTTTTGATATMTFTGNRVEYHAEKRFNHGIAEVSIVKHEGTSTVAISTNKVVDLYNARRDNAREMVFDSGPLTNGQYTITIRMTGTKNPLATETNIIIDYLKFYKVQ